MAKRDIQDIRFEHPDGADALVEVVQLDALRRRRADALYAPQRRDFHVVHVVTSGRGCHHFEFGLVHLRKGDVFHIRAGQVDWYDRDSRHNALLLVFLPEAVPASSLSRLRIANPLRPSGPDFDRLEKLARLIDSFQRVVLLKSAAVHMLKGFVDALCALGADAASARHPAHRIGLCERFEELLGDHGHEQRSVAWYAERLRVSAKTLGRASESVFGCSAKQYIDRSVTLQAKRLFVHTNASVEEVAAQLGFSEPTNFVKFFRRIEACTPRTFRDRFGNLASS